MARYRLAQCRSRARRCEWPRRRRSAIVQPPPAASALYPGPPSQPGKAGADTRVDGRDLAHTLSHACQVDVSAQIFPSGLSISFFVRTPYPNRVRTLIVNCGIVPFAHVRVAAAPMARIAPPDLDTSSSIAHHVHAPAGSSSARDHPTSRVLLVYAVQAASTAIALSPNYVAGETLDGQQDPARATANDARDGSSTTPPLVALRGQWHPTLVPRGITTRQRRQLAHSARS